MGRNRAVPGHTSSCGGSAGSTSPSGTPRSTRRRCPWTWDRAPSCAPGRVAVVVACRGARASAGSARERVVPGIGWGWRRSVRTGRRGRTPAATGGARSRGSYLSPRSYPSPRCAHRRGRPSARVPAPSMGRTIGADSGPGGCPSAGRSATVVEATVVATVVEATAVEAIARGSFAEIVAPRPRPRAPPRPPPPRPRVDDSRVGGALGAAGIVVLAPLRPPPPPRTGPARRSTSRRRVVPAAVASVVLVLVAPPVAAEAVVAFVAFAPPPPPAPRRVPRSDAPPARVGGEVAGQCQTMETLAAHA